ncbi:MAG TPA: VCBS repeat-containing protein, partial [Thermoleophilaceae bacterium]|nr:VCBS repeat-containing protein [Thermoleophilaceae bacterium]
MPALILVLLLVLLPAASASAAGGGFGDGTAISVDTPVSVPVGDFNEDGRADLVAVSNTTGYVYVRLGRADGGFTEEPPTQVGGSYLSQAVAGDFTGDGEEDLAVASFVNDKVHILTGLGDGGLIVGETITLDRHPTSLLVGDFNADGKEDLAIQNEKSGLGSQLSIRLGTGVGTFTSVPDKAVKGEALAISDFNSDQKEDLVFGDGGTPAGGVLLGTGTGAFNAGADIALQGFAGISRSWVTADFNGDGNQDIAASLHDKAQVSVRLGKGDGTFGGGPDLPVGTKPGALATGDVDGDGDQDLVVANFGSGTVRVWQGGGAGDFVSYGDLPVGKEPVELALADFDGDGVDDLAVANAGSGVTVHRGLATPALTGNLLVNGGFEGERAGGAADDSPDIPGWEASGLMTFMRYGSASHAYMPSVADSPRFGTGGSSFLWGGKSTATGGVTAAAQTVDVAAAGASIDAGRATAGLSAYLG